MQRHTQAGHHTDITFMRKIIGYIQLPWLMEQYPRVPVFALCNFLSGFVSIGLMAAFAVLLHSPFIFPSLGILTQIWQLVVIMIAIILLTLQAIAINRLFGMPLPLWSQSPAKAKKMMVSGAH